MTKASLRLCNSIPALASACFFMQSCAKNPESADSSGSESSSFTVSSRGGNCTRSSSSSRSARNSVLSSQTTVRHGQTHSVQSSKYVCSDKVLRQFHCRGEGSTANRYYVVGEKRTHNRDELHCQANGTWFNPAASRQARVPETDGKQLIQNAGWMTNPSFRSVPGNIYNSVDRMNQRSRDSSSSSYDNDSRYSPGSSSSSNDDDDSSGSSGSSAPVDRPPGVNWGTNAGGGGCGTFNHRTEAKLDGQWQVCLDGKFYPVSQTCYNPTNPVGQRIVSSGTEIAVPQVGGGITYVIKCAGYNDMRIEYHCRIETTSADACWRDLNNY